jgi:hypothetical protein
MFKYDLMSGSKVERTRHPCKGLNITIALVVLVLLGGILLVQPFQYSDNNANDKTTAAFAQGPQGGNYTFGILASIQNNENDDPFWIVSGNWRTNLLDIANQSRTASQGNMSGQGPSPVFNTSVRMINFNGTGEHTHSVTSFVLENVTMPNNITAIFNGMSTANFSEGPITDIPTTISITNGKVISIWLDPAKINYHYGDTPVYGIVLKEMLQPSLN